jgi:hypothetical protein
VGQLLRLASSLWRDGLGMICALQALRAHAL